MMSTPASAANKIKRRTIYTPEPDRRSDDTHIIVNVKRTFHSDVPANGWKYLSAVIILSLTIPFKLLCRLAEYTCPMFAYKRVTEPSRQTRKTHKNVGGFFSRFTLAFCSEEATASGGMVLISCGNFAMRLTGHCTLGHTTHYTDVPAHWVNMCFVSWTNVFTLTSRASSRVIGRTTWGSHIHGCGGTENSSNKPTGDLNPDSPQND